MPVALLDLIVLGVVLLSALLAAVRGFTREVLAIVSWIAAAVAALLLHPHLLPYVKTHIANPTIALVVTIAAIFLVTLIIVSFITVQLSDFVLDSRIGAVDRSLGFLFGAARGFLICVVGFIFFNWLVKTDMQPDWVLQARTRPLLQSTGDSLIAMLPDDPESTILQKFRQPSGDGGTDAPADSDTAPQTPPPADAAPAPQRRTQAPAGTDAEGATGSAQ
ncbi:CvpA family protein [Chelatococcus sp. GCM10030263]|uniref:CvpA family protein n=1 Tax=Chelatococcus sp. GCM10030263 TaxID=3273387 RepID=UPI0036240B89